MSMCRRSTPGCVDANQPDLQSSRPGRDPGIIQPATPSTTEFNNHESLFCEFNRPQCGGPPRDIRVPIRGDRNSLHGAGSITEDLRRNLGSMRTPRKFVSMLGVGLRPSTAWRRIVSSASKREL
jgi:hypothetical protein